MLKVGLLGAGRIGQVHAAVVAAHEGSTLAAISDIYAPAAEELAAKYHAQVKNSDEIIADDAINAVLILILHKHYQGTCNLSIDQVFLFQQSLPKLVEILNDKISFQHSIRHPKLH